MHCKMWAEATGQGPGHFRIFLENDYALSHTSPDLQPSSTTYVDIRLGLRGGWENHNSTDIQSSRVAIRNPHSTVVRPTFPSAVRMVQLEASRSFSAESQLFPPPVRVLSGRRKKAACLLRTASETSPEGLLPFPVPEQFSPVAGGTLQILATGFSLRLSIVMHRVRRSVQSFLWDGSIKTHGTVPLWETVLRRENLQYRYAAEMNRFTGPKRSLQNLGSV